MSFSINMGSVNRQIDDIEQYVEEEGEDFVREILLLLFAYLVQLTPVLTGRARGGWMAGLHTPPTGAPESGLGSYPEPDPPTSEAQRFRLGMIAWIVNNVEYIVPLDEGSSAKAPAGMTAVALANLEAELG